MPKTHIVLVVDRSGSMQAIREDAQGGIAAFLSDQAAQPGDATVSLYQFDTSYERVFGPIPVANAPAYELRPRGSTALLDALGKAITETAEHVAGLPEGPDVIVAVTTDGQENASREWNRDGIRKQITEKTALGWQFAFLSADLDAVREARDLGVAVAASASYDATPEGTRDAYRSLSHSVTRTRSTGARLTVDGNQ